MARFKVGDKVRVKSKEWYDSKKNIDGDIVSHGVMFFTYQMQPILGSTLTIGRVCGCAEYYAEGCPWCISDYILESNKVEEKCITTEIDWEQRRYELAKDCLSSSLHRPIPDGVTMTDVVLVSINLADEMIKELKNENYDV